MAKKLVCIVLACILLSGCMPDNDQHKSVYDIGQQHFSNVSNTTLLNDDQLLSYVPVTYLSDLEIFDYDTWSVPEDLKPAEASIKAVWKDCFFGAPGHEKIVMYDLTAKTATVLDTVDNYYPFTINDTTYHSPEDTPPELQLNMSVVGIDNNYMYWRLRYGKLMATARDLYAIPLANLSSGSVLMHDFAEEGVSEWIFNEEVYTNYNGSLYFNEYPYNNDGTVSINLKKIDANGVSLVSERAYFPVVYQNSLSWIQPISKTAEYKGLELVNENGTSFFTIENMPVGINYNKGVFVFKENVFWDIYRDISLHFDEWEELNDSGAYDENGNCILVTTEGLGAYVNNVYVPLVVPKTASGFSKGDIQIAAPITDGQYVGWNLFSEKTPILPMYYDIENNQIILIDFVKTTGDFTEVNTFFTDNYIVASVRHSESDCEYYIFQK